MAGFIDSLGSAWSKVTYPFRSDGMMEDFLNSDVFPFHRYEELLKIPANKMSDAERAEYERLGKQVDKSAESVGGVLGVVAERSTKAALDTTGDVVSGIGRGATNAIKDAVLSPYTKPLEGVMGWLSNNWKIVAAAVVGIVGMFSGGIIGTLAVAGAGLFATDHFVKQGTGKGLLDTFFANKSPDVVLEKSASKAVEIEKGVAKEITLAQPVVATEKAMEELAERSGINYHSNWAAQENPKKENGFVRSLVDGAKTLVGDDVSEGRFA